MLEKRTKHQVDELITCITKEQQAEALDGKHYTEAAFDNSLTALANL
jgi:hypothetical protein